MPWALCADGIASRDPEKAMVTRRPGVLALTWMAAPMRCVAERMMAKPRPLPSWPVPGHAGCPRWAVDPQGADGGFKGGIAARRRPRAHPDLQFLRCEGLA